MTEQSKTPRTDALEIPSELLLLLKTPLMGAAIKIAAKTLYDHANKLEAELTEATAENVRICADYERAFNRGLKAGDEQSIAQQTALLEALSRAERAEAVLAALTAQDNAKARLQAIREIYNGMDGFEPKTAPEDYLLRIVRQMYHAAIHEEGK